jgi:hypothetical protein
MASRIVKRIVLGAEYDERLRQLVRETLLRLGAKELSRKNAIGGSQEVEFLEVEVAGQRLFVEAETYIGLSIAGDPDLVDQIHRIIVERLAGD